MQYVFQSITVHSCPFFSRGWRSDKSCIVSLKFSNYYTYSKKNLLDYVEKIIFATIFSLRLIHELRFHDDLNFSKNFCNRFRCSEFKAIKLNSFFLIKRSMFKDVWDWIYEKSIEAFRFYEILNFSKKGGSAPSCMKFKFQAK